MLWVSEVWQEFCQRATDMALKLRKVDGHYSLNCEFILSSS